MLYFTKEIARRTGEMHEDKLKLPWRAPNDLQKPSTSRFGHKSLIDKAKATRAKYEAYIKAYCDDDSNGGNRAPEGCRARNPVDLSQPTDEEIRLQIEAAERMEEFWKDILVGSVAAGAGFLAPELLPALLPGLPIGSQIVPQFAH